MRKKGRQITGVKPQRIVGRACWRYHECRVIDRLKERDTDVSGTRGSRSDRQRMFYD